MEARLVITQEFVSIRFGSNRVAVQIEGERENALANAILMLPEVFRQLRKAGVTAVVAEGPALRGPLSVAEWCLLVPKGDQELEAARQAALEAIPVRGVAKVVSLAELGDALGQGSRQSSGSDLD